MMQLLTTFPNSINVNYFDIPRSYIPHMLSVSREINEAIEAKIERDKANSEVKTSSQDKRYGELTVEELQELRKVNK